jgi:hypothetical protein
MGVPQQLTTSTAALQLRRRGRTCDEISDRVLAGLVRRRLELQRRQGWAAFGLFGGALATLVLAAIAGPSELILGIAGAGIATLAMGLGFCVERAARWRFQGDARLCGLSDEAAAVVYRSAVAAEDMLEVLRSCGQDPSDEELARFVR